MRKDRNFDQLRDVTFETNFNLHAEGSCLVKFVGRPFDRF